jgi:cytochrome c-type biogenesis protein
VTGGVDTTVIAAFAVGFVSFISPCVLPLVPGYLSAVSGVSVAEMKTGERSLSRILFPAIASASVHRRVRRPRHDATGIGSSQDSRDARQGRRRGDHRARPVLPAHAFSPAQPHSALTR